MRSENEVVERFLLAQNGVGERGVGGPHVEPNRLRLVRDEPGPDEIPNPRITRPVPPQPAHSSTVLLQFPLFISSLTDWYLITNK